MALLLAGGATWLLLVFLVLSLCRAAARADATRGARRLAVAATTAAAAVSTPAAEAAAACPNARVAYDAAPAEARDALLCEIARTRERRDRGRLQGDRRLKRAAGRHAADMVRRGYFAHDSPGGGTLRDRLRRAGYVRSGCSWRAGEVLAWGTGSRSTARSTVRAWLRSRSHRRIVVSRRYDEVGVGLRAGTPRSGGESGVTVVAVLGDRRCST